jgi:hypothetical protein
MLNNNFDDLIFINLFFMQPQKKNSQIKDCPKISFKNLPLYHLREKLKPHPKKSRTIKLLAMVAIKELYTS